MSLSIIEFSQAILKLNKEKKYAEALKFFKENKAHLSGEQIANNGYLIAGMITALRHTNNFDNAFKFLNHYKLSIDYNTKEIVLNAYGWLLFSKFKAESLLNDNHHTENEIFEDEEAVEDNGDYHFNKSEIIQLIENFIPLSLCFDNEFAYSVLSNLFNSVLKAEKKKPNANWQFVSDLCDKIEPNLLTTNCRTINVVRKGVTKPMELASDKENWFAYKSKALMKLGKFQECYDISKLALDSFENFHYSNDIWFARRIALSKKNLGNSEDAIKELQLILRKKKEWFIQKELAELYKEQGNNDKAFALAIEAINNFGDIEFKIDLLYLLGELHKTKDQSDLAFQHYVLSLLIRQNEGWSIPEKLGHAIGQFSNEKIPLDKLPALKSELKKYWNSFKFQSERPVVTNQKLSGKIDKILHNDEKGTDGFIKYNGNKSVYFRINADDNLNSKISIGLDVEFKIIPATVDKKQKAIQVREIK
jgi:tetratricopeptide (TPR) repeat protein